MRRQHSRSKNGKMERLPLPGLFNIVKSRSTQYRLTDDGRHGTSSRFIPVQGVEAPSASHNDTGNNSDATSHPMHDWNDMPVEEDGQEGSTRRRRAGRPLMDWLEDREQFLSEAVRSEGRGDSSLLCARCASGRIAEYRCVDCDGMDLVCESCILALHERCGLHHIEKWGASDGFFKCISLRSLGFSFLLGHPPGSSCPSPARPYNGTFTIVDINGIHDVNVLFCGCHKQVPHFIQLLRYGWFPATVKFPRSAFTFRLLRFYQVLSFESKSTVFEMHKTLARLTDNTGVNAPKDRYTEMQRVVREYSHISMLKRGGRAHEPSGAAGTRAGELAVLCPACPQVGMNLPPDWENVAASKRFLYGLFLGLDANFRLKRKIVSSHSRDPGLSRGWAYFVEEDEFKDFLHRFGTLIVQEPSKCSNHDAVNRERAMEGYAASGAGTCDCTRHDMKRPNGVGDLQKGERYLNMDYVFFKSLNIRPTVPFITVSYDIACQWSIKLMERMKIYPPAMHVLDRAIRYFIPKFHLPAHILACLIIYSLNYNKDCARTDGEGVERGWDHINPIAASTREMGPGNRRDTLDAHFGDWNWKKTCRMADFLLRQIKEAVLELEEKSHIHDEFSNGLPKDDVKSWEAQLDAWEADNAQKNPFEPSYKALSQQSVRRQLAEEETKALNDGTAFSMHEDVSASQLITLGLELENQQRKLAVDQELLGIHATDDQKTKITLRSNALQRKVDAWIEIEHMYIPSLRVLRSKAAESKENLTPLPAHEVPLLLPSALSPTMPCDVRLRQIEWRLRLAQCTDALDDLRDGLCLRSFVLIDKSRFQRGQRQNTRSQGIVDRIQAKVKAAANRYRTARAAISKLAVILQQVGWEGTIRALKDEDIRPLTPEDSHQGKGKTSAPSEGRRTLSWIWTQMGNSMEFKEDERLDESLRIEWCKSRARRDRWKEEVELLQEEMRRVKEFFQTRAQQWEDLARSDSGNWALPGVIWDRSTVEGRTAYARGQASQFKAMKDRCIKQTGHGVQLVPESSNDAEDNDDDEADSSVRSAEYGAYD
ncbi:hypothetical protein CVT26_004585 [Gymnopilus dilepis]|uniref:CxC2-like cysteine cluster KDZ transposase-associated domain-containing protein n=1 Tax=Gymnopilus dilepis TaxID=231916 RepID=A0A409WC55_9AGAR|nr:hypothetical protein CVT26_004585 [Gymnopilus dilepis]